jgi:hypothetical protein
VVLLLTVEDARLVLLGVVLDEGVLEEIQDIQAHIAQLRLDLNENKGTRRKGRSQQTKQNDDRRERMIAGWTDLLAVGEEEIV